VGSTNPGRRARTFEDTPPGEADVPTLADITVGDPHHPLFGRRFRVLRLAVPGRGHPSPSYEVEYLPGTTLRIPVAASERSAGAENLTKLSVEALRDLISLIELLGTHGDRAEDPVVDAASGAPAADPRRDRRGAGGDAP
jgi:hypothetical protein